ncbi:MAG: DNA polymerase III subunit delta [Planctomyces sp.]|nr:DNA polymerase III subunit delta [Planctomyces sp.]
MHATEFLAGDPGALPPVIIATGTQWKLRQSVLTRLVELALGGDDASLTKLVGKTAEWPHVRDELALVSMWGDKRLVLIEEADDFVTKFRGSIEKYFESPAKKSILLLEVKTLPKTTRIAKLCAAKGLEIDCSELKGVALTKWLTSLAKSQYGKSLSRDALALLVELVGEDLGTYEQELSKLSSFVGSRNQIELDDVKGMVGGWTTETTWSMTDAARDGDLARSLACLQDLLRANEAPQKLLGGVTFVFRKLAVAAELSRSMPLGQAMKEAGVFPRDHSAVEAYFRRIGRTRADRLHQILLEADVGLKGGSKLPDRIQMEKLLMQLSGK